MKIIVTCGPSYEPLDQVRRLTNFSTGRDWFPEARVVGWKYELSGTSTDAFAKAWRQIHESRTDGCVLNGSAYGHGFAFCHPSGHVQVWNDLAELCSGLQEWLNAPNPLRGPVVGDLEESSNEWSENIFDQVRDKVRDEVRD